MRQGVERTRLMKRDDKGSSVRPPATLLEVGLFTVGQSPFVHRAESPRHFSAAESSLMKRKQSLPLITTGCQEKKVMRDSPNEEDVKTRVESLTKMKYVTLHRRLWAH